LKKTHTCHPWKFVTNTAIDLTGTHPEPVDSSLAGVSHDLSLKTAYYTAQVPIWLDLISTPSEWATSFLAPEAKEVLTALGGVAVVFPIPGSSGANSSSSGGPGPTPDATRNLIREVGRLVKEGLGGWEWDGVGLGIGIGDFDNVDEWDDCCVDAGLEFVQVKGGSKDVDKNEFGGELPVGFLYFNPDLTPDLTPDIVSYTTRYLHHVLYCTN
jgi:alpha- and gamma-adaptin-binding protein p34